MASRLQFSKKVLSFQYDPDNCTLIIQFTAGIVKKYFDVPQTLVDTFEKASDRTIFYEEKINGYFRVQ